MPLAQTASCWKGVSSFCSGSKSTEEALKVYGAVQRLPRLSFRVLNFRKSNIRGFCKIFYLPSSNVARVILDHVIVISLKYLYIKNF